MIASILLLVPGVPSVNAQNDILEGHPTLGSARAVTVAVILIFVAAGLWFGQVLLVATGDSKHDTGSRLSPASNRLRRDRGGRLRRAVQHRLPLAAVVRGQRRAGAGGAH